jgi:hypothetical protein
MTCHDGGGNDWCEMCAHDHTDVVVSRGIRVQIFNFLLESTDKLKEMVVCKEIEKDKIFL